MATKHAKLSPSGADAWSDCTAKPGMEAGYPNKNSDASRAGTTCHQMQEELLRAYLDELDICNMTQSYLGRGLVFWHHDESVSRGESWSEELTEQDWGVLRIEATVVVTQEMVNAVANAVDIIIERHQLLGGQMLVEQRVPVGQFTGELDEENESGYAEGSADVIFLGVDWIEAVDSKFGRKPVYAFKILLPPHVDIFSGSQMPEKRGPNRQIGSYALGAIEKHDPCKLVDKVTMTVVQPFIDHISSYTCDIAELRELEDFLRAKAEETRTNPKFSPTFENCLFCRAKGNCGAQSNRAMVTVFDGFGDTDTPLLNKPNPLTLGSQYAMVSFVEQWAKDIEAAVRTKLEAGEPVVRNDGQGYKLIEGKGGPRQWRDPAEAEAYLKQMRVKRDDMYSHTVISPTQAEKLATPAKVKKGETPPPALLGPRVWGKLQGFITQSVGKPRIALETNPHPALLKAAGFEDVSTQDDDLAALFGE